MKKERTKSDKKVSKGPDVAGQSSRSDVLQDLDGDRSDDSLGVE